MHDVTYFRALDHAIMKSKICRVSPQTVDPGKKRVNITVAVGRLSTTQFPLAWDTSIF
jgi:hypothetical protein